MPIEGHNELEPVWGLTEVTMIRLPTSEWASADEQERLREICASAELSDDWPMRMSAIARNSTGFRRWLASLSKGTWEPPEGASITDKPKLDQVDFALPWCARLRWGSRWHTSVDVFLCATGGVAGVGWETI